MYKIYINETPLILAQTNDLQSLDAKRDQVLVNVYSGKTKHFLQVIDMLEKTNRWESVVLYDEDVKKMWKSFKSLYKRISAAGGVVRNPKGEILMIHRLGFWDLPKGKIDPGETKKEAAIREVEEETGVQGLTLISKIKNTFHTYRLNNGTRVLKKTYWYRMTANHQDLVPQTEENISQAVWKDWIKEKDLLKPIYKNIEDVMSKYQSDHGDLSL